MQGAHLIRSRSHLLLDLRGMKHRGYEVIGEGKYLEKVICQTFTGLEPSKTKHQLYRSFWEASFGTVLYGWIWKETSRHLIHSGASCLIVWFSAIVWIMHPWLRAFETHEPRKSSSSTMILKHNDLEDPASKLDSVAPQRPRIIAFESVYSMSGSIAPIEGITFLDK